MPDRNGKRKPPRPQIEVQGATASPEEAVAISAALERFLRETAAAPEGAPRSRWLDAALREAVCAGEEFGRGWGHGWAANCEFASERPIRIEHLPQTRSEWRKPVAVVKIIELVGSSKKSSDDAAQQALKQAQSSLRNIRAIDVVSTGLRGENLDEWRAHVRVAFLVEGTDVD